MARFDVIVVGDLNVDLVFSGIDGFPTLGRERLAQECTMAIGGSGGIFASALARLGAKVGFVGKVGEDVLGDYLIGCVEKDGVDVSRIIRDPLLKTGITISLTYPSDRALVTYSGSMATLAQEEISLDYLQMARHIHFTSFFLLKELRSGYPWILAKCKEMGLTTSVDTGYDPEERWNGNLKAALSQVDIFLPNEGEALHITGEKELYLALEKLVQEVGMVVVKLSSRGSIARRGEKVFRREAFPVPVKDSTGAGDSFDAGFLYAYLKGLDIESCLTYANACGALSASAMGGSSGYCSLAEVESFLTSSHA